MRTPLAPLLVVAIACASCLPVVEGVDERLADQEVRLSFLHTSDIHSRLLPFNFNPLKTDVDLGLIPDAAPFGGAARLAALAKRERQRGDRVIHLDSGDCFQGAPIFNLNNGEAEFKFLSLMHVDAAVVGNHEFDSGALNFTVQARNHARFPLLAANYLWDDYRQDPASNESAKVTEPYTIINAKGVRVGVIGMANISSLNSLVEGGNSLQATPLEQNEAARGYVELLKPVTDLIVIVSHLGLTEDQDLIQGYEAYYEYGRIKQFVHRDYAPWTPVDWYGEKWADDSVVQVHIPGVSGIDVVLGGHLHVVLNPPQLLTDPLGRKVVLAHSGAFAKYLGRLDVVVKMPPASGAAEGAEVRSHDYRVFPVDAVWCSDAVHQYYSQKFWNPGDFLRDPQVIRTASECSAQEDKYTTELLHPYILTMDYAFALTNIFGYAPRDIARRNNSTGGDAPLGNMAADSMRKRRRVEAELAVTNTLGIRDNLYAGPLTQEAMFNVFPFENTINVMYLSGTEVQELFDFITERSSGRGCQSQAQISGGRFTMDCAQVQLNDIRFACDATRQGPDNGADCPQANRENHAPWQCIDDGTGGRCWAHSGTNISISGKPLDKYATYRVAVNDYIAKGGSGFKVLKRNTTRIETGISLRDSLIGYMQNFCSCADILGDRRDEFGNPIGKNGQLCGALTDGRWVVDDQARAFCQAAAKFERDLEQPIGPCTCRELLSGNTAKCAVPEVTFELRKECTDKMSPGPAVGACSCREVLAGDTPACGHVTPQLRSFCENPTAMAIAVGVEDGRIERRVK